MIKVVIFDADGVLIHAKRFSESLSKEYKIPMEKILPFFEGPFQACITGHADLKEAISPYLSEWGWTGNVESLLDYWFKLEHKIDEELVSYIQELRKNGIQCFLATNNEKYRFEYMLEKMGFSKCFDRTYASSHLGLKKPNTEFFRKIFDELPDISKNEILFLDNDVDNIQGAKDFGIKAEIYTTLEDLKKILHAENN